jgi:lipopolysaccharide export LptBFGC system permease protein LptF
MKIYARYLIIKLIISFFILNCVFLGLVSLVQILKFIYLMGKGALLGEILDVVILSMPSLLFAILPLSAGLSVSYTYFKSIHAGEITLLRIMGLNNLLIAMPGLLVSFAVTGLVYYMMTISPIFFTRLKNLMFELRNNYALELIQANSFNKVNKDVTIYVGKKMQQDSFENILVFDKSQQGKLFVAQKGSLKFADGVLGLILENGVAHTANHNLQFSQFSVKIDLYSNKIARATKDLEEYSLKELLASSKLKLLAQGHKRIIWPLYSLVLTSFALSILLAKNSIDLKVKIHIILYAFILISSYFGLYVLSVRNIHFLYLQYIFAFGAFGASLYKLAYL